ncbi:MAG: DNA polymerase III subunit epsilon [Betaproteobacteria bacterium]|nr:DNA polymerase III subunit epsilon [Betaproteobacteria bacterium]
MRQIVLDTETTGLDPALGHRIVEVACVEIVHRRITEQTFHQYVNPERPSDPGALAVHGLTQEFLSEKPRFGDVVGDFLDFVSGSELIIHNAPFDVAFLNAELARLDRPPIESVVASVLDSLQFAKQLHPGKRNSLDALCERYTVDNSARTLHGALLDARLLGEVYLAMTRGQESLVIDIEENDRKQIRVRRDAGTGELVVQAASEEELEAHEEYLSRLDDVTKGACLWLRRSDAS